MDSLSLVIIIVSLGSIPLAVSMARPRARSGPSPKKEAAKLRRPLAIPKGQPSSAARSARHHGCLAVAAVMHSLLSFLSA